MVMHKNMKIISKIRIHPFTYLVILLCMFSGKFHDFTMLSILFVIHELGHILTSMYFKWQIDKILFLPFGGITIFKENLNRPIKEEFLILIMGPLFQILGYLFFQRFFSSIFLSYHLFFLIFNLLPLIPLDGSKLLELGLQYFYSFKKSHLGMIYSSYSLLFLLLLWMFKIHNFMFIVVFFFLLIKGIEERRKHQLLCERFLLERYLKNFNFTKNCILKSNDLYQMKRDYKHLFYSNNYYYIEKELLKKKFQNRIN